MRRRPCLHSMSSWAKLRDRPHAFRDRRLQLARPASRASAAAWSAASKPRSRAGWLLLVMWTSPFQLFVLTRGAALVSGPHGLGEQRF